MRARDLTMHVTYFTPIATPKKHRLEEVRFCVMIVISFDRTFYNVYMYVAFQVYHLQACIYT